MGNYAGRHRAHAALAAVLLLLAGCDLLIPESIRVTAPEPTFQIRVEFEGGDPGSYAVSFEPSLAQGDPVAQGGGVFLSSELRYGDFATSDSDPAAIRVFATRNDDTQRLSVTITQIESSMTPPGEQILYEEVLEAAGTAGASENPTLEIELTQAVPRS